MARGKAEKIYPVSLYVNGGYALTLFEVKTPYGGWGDLGVKYTFEGGVSLLGCVHAETFIKLYEANNPMILRYNTQMLGASFGVIYEVDLGRGFYWGPGVMVSDLFFRSNGYAPAGFVSTSNYNDLFKSPIIYSARLFMNIRKKLGRRVDIQIGGEYNQLGTYYADLYTIDGKPKYDGYLGGYLGFVYHMGVPSFHGAKQSKFRIDMLGCPKF